ncbi:MAG: copper transporter [Actinomycetota bacterium]
MISFRFHLVSLVAVFLALGLGVLTGTTVLNRGIVAQLERQTDLLTAGRDSLREQLSELGSEAEAWSAFGREVMDYIVEGRLVGTRVVVVTQEEADDGGVEGVRHALEIAGAEVEAVISADVSVNATGQAETEQLAEAIGAEPTAPELAQRAAEALADRLVTGASSDDVLERLLDAGFLRSRGPAIDAATLERLAGPNLLVVVVSGGEQQPALAPEQFLVPFTARIAERGLPLAATESVDSVYPFVEVLRRDGSLAERIVTQDNVDQTAGEVGLILALRDLLIDDTAGHYGVKDGAARLLPAP